MVDLAGDKLLFFGLVPVSILVLVTVLFFSF